MWDGKERRATVMSCNQDILTTLTAVHTLQIEMRQDLLHLKQTVTEHHHTLYGNDKTGLATDVDRLKQQAQMHGWWAAAISALGLKTLWDIMTRSK